MAPRWTGIATVKRVPPPGLLNFFQLRLPPGYPAPRGAEKLAVIVDEMREKLPGMLAVMDPGKGRGCIELRRSM